MDRTDSKIFGTRRLVLRPFRASDAEQAFVNWMSDPAVTHFLTWTPHEDVSFTQKLLAAWEAEAKSPDVYHWAIVWRETCAVIGDLSVVSADRRSGRAEVGYCLSRAFWGRGVMTEALSAAIAYLFCEAGFLRIEAKHAAANPASGRVMEKCGMRTEGTLRKYFRLLSTGELTDIVVRSVLREEWERGAGGDEYRRAK